MKNGKEPQYNIHSPRHNKLDHPLQWSHDQTINDKLNSYSPRCPSAWRKDTKYVYTFDSQNMSLYYENQKYASKISFIEAGIIPMESG
jgi:hypothetical protein